MREYSRFFLSCQYHSDILRKGQKRMSSIVSNFERGLNNGAHWCHPASVRPSAASMTIRMLKYFRLRPQGYKCVWEEGSVSQPAQGNDHCWAAQP